MPTPITAVLPSNLMNWIAVNAPASARQTVTEAWFAYLRANGGTGITQHDLEQSFLTTQAVGPGTLVDRWNAFLAAQPGTNSGEKSRSKYR